jgi:hypothetical protein
MGWVLRPSLTGGIEDAVTDGKKRTLDPYILSIFGVSPSRPNFRPPVSVLANSLRCSQENYR